MCCMEVEVGARRPGGEGEGGEGKGKRDEGKPGREENMARMWCMWGKQKVRKEEARKRELWG